MNRLLLAMLALFAGLAAQITPAQARMPGSDAAAVGTVDNCRGSRPAPSSSAEADVPVLRQAKRERDTVRPRPVRSRVFIPSVFFGPDRALE